MVNGIYRSDTGTRTATFEPMLAEDHMALYREEETGDVIVVNYVLDRTEHYRLEEKERALEKSNREYAKLLEEEKKAYSYDRGIDKKTAKSAGVIYRIHPRRRQNQQ